MEVVDRFSSSLRESYSSAVINNECVRLFHGRGKTYETLDFFNIDFYPPAIFITVFKEDLLFDTYLNVVLDLVGKETSVIVQKRYLRPVERENFGPDVDRNLVCKEGGLSFCVNLLTNQNPGLFLDMKLGKDWLRDNSKDKSILNLFSYTCSVSAYALKGGANKVLNIDQKKSFLNIGRENHKLNNLDSHVEFRNWDVTKSINQIARKGPFDIVFCDPPTNQGASFYYKKDYPKVIRKSSKLLESGGVFMACLNTPFEDIGYLHDLFTNDDHSWELVDDIFSSPDFPEVDKNNGLKIVVYRLLK